MRDNNTHKMQCMIQNNKKMIGRCFKSNDRYSTSLKPMTSTIKFERRNITDKHN